MGTRFIIKNKFKILFILMLLFVACNISELVNNNEETYDDFIIEFTNGDFSYEYIGWEIDKAKHKNTI